MRRGGWIRRYGAAMENVSDMRVNGGGPSRGAHPKVSCGGTAGEGTDTVEESWKEPTVP